MEPTALTWGAAGGGSLTLVVLHEGPQLLLLLAVSEGAVACVGTLPLLQNMGTYLQT